MEAAMRQFLLGLLAAAGLWWLYDSWIGEGALAHSGDASPAGEGASGAPTLDDLIRVDAPADAPGGSPPGDAEKREVPDVPVARPLDGGAQREDQGLAERWAEFATGVEAGDATVIATSWAALADGRGAESSRHRLASLLAAGTDDPGQLLARLGSNNAFLHSVEGRQHAARVLAAIAPLPDDKGLALATRLVEVCMRGPIPKEATDAKAAVDTIYAHLKVRADRWLCDPANVAKARSYTVAKGDSLSKIAGKFRREGLRVEEGTLAILNRIHNPNALQVGQRIKIPVDPLHVIVEKASFLMAVYVGDQMLRLYWVGHGADDKTPAAEFSVGTKVAHPDWTAPDGKVYAYGQPGNILGDYFIKFAHEQYTGFGAHGTPQPESIGTMSSMGCIRMLAADIAELYRLLPVGARVEIRDTK
jgi:nucleoid-associated protein YgaU